MKYIKKFELVENEPQVGDFVQIKTNNKFYGFYEPNKIIECVNNSIGQIINIGGISDIIIRYNRETNFPGEITSKFLDLRFYKKDIVEIGKSKEEVIMKLNSKKYNL